MMKKLLALAALALSSPAAAQSTFPLNNIPMGRGPGVSGYAAIAPGADGTCLRIVAGVPSFVSCPAAAPGGSNLQIQYNNAGSFGGLTDVQVTARIQRFTNVLDGAVPFSGGGTTKFLRADQTWATPPSGPNASQYGIVCDGVTDDGPAFITAMNALNGAPLVLPAGTCRIATTAFFNKWVASGSGILTAPGPKIQGQGRMVTYIETDVANGYALAINPDWAALHKSMFILTSSNSGGSLATNTYFVQTTVTDPGGNEINVSPAKVTTAITGPNGSISLTLQPLNTGYCYNVYIGTSSTPANSATIGGSNAVCITPGAKVITAVGSARPVPTNKIATWQETALSDLSVVNYTATANASGVLWFRVGYSNMTNVYMENLTGSGLVVPNWTGDNDGSFVITVDKSKFSAISGWCINAAGNTLEFSNFTVSNSVFNQCGANPPNINVNFTMTSITNANPGVVTTASPHTLQVEDQIFIAGVTGMSLPQAFYKVCGTVTATTFSLCDLNGDNINTTALGAYTASSGAEQLAWRPPKLGSNGDLTMSGAIAYTGLIANFLNLGFTQNVNVGIYLTEAGASDNILIQSTDFENTYGKGLFAASVINLHMLNNECLTAVGIGTTISCVQLGTGANRGGAINVTIDGMKVRSNVAGVFANGFEQVKGAGGLIYRETVQVKNVFWQTWLASTKYFGFRGNPHALFWLRADGKTGATCAIQGALNVTSCTRTGVGTYQVTLTNPSLDAFYIVSGICSSTAVNAGTIFTNTPGSITSSTFTFLCLNLTGLAAMDADVISIQGFGNPN